MAILATTPRFAEIVGLAAGAAADGDALAASDALLRISKTSRARTTSSATLLQIVCLNLLMIPDVIRAFRTTKNLPCTPLRFDQRFPLGKRKR